MDKQEMTWILVVAGIWAFAIVAFMVKMLRAGDKRPRLSEAWTQPPRATLIWSYVFDAILLALVWGAFFFGLIGLWVAVAVTAVGIFWTAFYAIVMVKSRESRRNQAKTGADQIP